MGSGAYRRGCDFGRSFTHHFGVVFGPRFWSSSVRGFACIWVFSGFGVLVGTCFWPTFGPCFRPYFPALENLIIDSAAPKFLGRYFAHRRYEPLSRTSSVGRKVKKTQKTGIHESQIPATEPVSAYLEPGTSPPHLYPGQSPLHLQVSHRRHPTWRNHGPLIVLGTSREWPRLVIIGSFTVRLWFVYRSFMVRSRSVY